MKKIEFLIELVFFVGFTTMNVYAQCIDESLELMVYVAGEELDVELPTQQDPVKLNATVVFSENKEQLAIVMKVNILSNWHIYSDVNSKSPFIPTRIEMEIPNDGLIPLREWEKPLAKKYDDNTQIYEGEDLLFIRYYKVGELLKFDTTWKCGLYYQACDPFKCHRPETKMIDLVFK